MEKSNDEYAYGDILGKHGLEKFFDRLHSRPSRSGTGWSKCLRKRNLKNLGRNDPVSGYNLVLTIDADLQKAVGEAFEGRAGAAVVLDTRDGSVLAMFSSPSFDPNLFNSGISYDQWDKLQNNPLSPLSNKAISGQYPPGSTYKLIVAAAALEEGIIYSRY